MQNGIDIAVFDWNGTLSDDTHIVYAANMLVFEHYGLKILSLEEWRQIAALTVADLMQGLGVEDSSENITALYEKSYKEVNKKPRLFSDTKETLQKLVSNGIDVAIVSTHPRDLFEDDIITHRISEIVPLCYSGVSNKEIFLKKILESKNIESRRMAYVGDTIWDMRAAKNVDAYAIAVLTGFHTREQLEKESPDLITERVGDIVDHIVTNSSV